MWHTIRQVVIYIRNLLLWISPFVLFLLVLALAMVFLKGKQDTFVELVRIVAWPLSTLITLFFFKKVVTYLFFSMEEFNFFGAKGTLKNVKDLIGEKVNERFSEEKKEESRQLLFKQLASELDSKKAEVAKAEGTASENLKLAKDVLASWEQASQSSKKVIDDLMVENKKLKEEIATPGQTVNRAGEEKASTPESGEISSGSVMGSPTS